MRNIIEKNLPKFETKISYGMPTYRDKRNLIHFAAQKQHLGIYPGSKAIEVFSEQLKGYSTSKGTIRIKYEEEIPYKLIGEIAKWNYENQRWL